MEHTQVVYTSLFNNMAEPIKKKVEKKRRKDGRFRLMVWANSIEEAQRINRMPWPELRAYLTKRDGKDPWPDEEEESGGIAKSHEEDAQGWMQNGWAFKADMQAASSDGPEEVMVMSWNVHEGDEGQETGSDDAEQIPGMRE